MATSELTLLAISTQTRLTRKSLWYGKPDWLLAVRQDRAAHRGINLHFISFSDFETQQIIHISSQAKQELSHLIIWLLKFWKWPSCQIRKIAGCAYADMPGTFSPSPRGSDPDMHHDTCYTCVTHVQWCMPGSLINGLLLSRFLEKRSQHSWSIHNLQFYVSGKRPMLDKWLLIKWHIYSLIAYTNRRSSLVEF